MKNKKNVIIFVLIIFLIPLVISAILMYISLQTNEKTVVATNDNTTILKEPEKTIEEETEDTNIEEQIEEVEEIAEEQKEEQKPVIEEKTEEKKNQTVANTSKPKQQVNNNESKKTTETKVKSNSEQKQETPKTQETPVQNTNTTPAVVEEKKEEKQENTQTQETKENNNTVETHPELAFTGYVERNRDKEKIVINWLKDELSKSESAVKFGYTVQSGDVIESGTNGFSMVESRVRHRVQNSIGGNYYVQVKDQYMYNSDGTAVNLTDTLVYIWEEF